MRFTGCSVLVDGKGNSLFKADTSLQIANTDINRLYEAFFQVTIRRAIAVWLLFASMKLI